MLLLLLFVCLLQLLPAQDTGRVDQIEVQFDYFKGNTFYGASKIYSKTEFRKLLSGNEPAIKLFEKGYRHQSNATLLAVLGGLVVLWPIGSAVLGVENPGWGIAAGGAAMIGISIPIYNGGSKRIKQAVDMYNRAP
jgi:hypothetical protein